MQKGDISNELPPRMLFVFEGLVGHCEVRNMKKEQLAVKLRRWKRAVSYWDLDELIGKHLWDLQWRYNFRLDCVTFKGPDFADALRSLFEQEYVPFSNVFAMTEHKLSRKLATMVDVARVFDPNPERMLTWGIRGVYVPSSTAFSPLA